MSKTTQDESSNRDAAPERAAAGTQPNAGFDEKPGVRRVGLARPALLAASAASLALGVAGAVAYSAWFNHDQRTYANAMESARRALRLNERPQPIQTATGVVLPQPALAPQSDPRVASAQEPVAAAQPDAQHPASAKQRSTVQTRADPPARTKASPNPFTKIAALFHPAGYRRHGTRHQSDTLGRP